MKGLYIKFVAKADCKDGRKRKLFFNIYYTFVLFAFKFLFVLTYYYILLMLRCSKNETTRRRRIILPYLHYIWFAFIFASKSLYHDITIMLLFTPHNFNKYKHEYLKNISKTERINTKWIKSHCNCNISAELQKPLGDSNYFNTINIILEKNRILELYLS